MGNDSPFRFDDDNSIKYTSPHFTTREMGKPQTRSYIHCITDNWENWSYFRHTLKRIFLISFLYIQCLQIGLQSVQTIEHAIRDIMYLYKCYTLSVFFFTWLVLDIDRRSYFCRMGQSFVWSCFRAISKVHITDAKDTFPIDTIYHFGLILSRRNCTTIRDDAKVRGDHLRLLRNL